ncbi:hypothetical protein CFAM422_008299 [Trichoderma lentiforme]|uniref:Uncharacterized protein n=1 Tax=Trichoderma lentiforme TaxID=1567552 RepID=A0A9P4XCR7_9HYPO|nr:hypothetical protein CFAM422_008299 [Trichoderma lentiforme]
MITFRPNCTLPEAPGVFVNASNVRSTMEIIWSCIGIIILSTWSILHPNIPPDFRKQAKWQFYLQKLYSVARKALWMIVMFVAPEALTSLYAHKMFSAHHNDAILKDLAADQQVPWSRTHTLFADMGGFAIYFSDKEFYPPYHVKIAIQIKNRLDEDQAMHWKLQTLAALSGDIWVLDSAQLIVAAKEGIIKLPKITKKELQDKSKSDALVKILAIIQVLWLIIQLAARRYYGLASAPFEISTVALSASTIILYILEWNKPKDVNTPIYIRANKVESPPEEKASSEATASQETTASHGSSVSRGSNTETTISEEAFKEAFRKVFEAAPYPYLRFPIIPTKLYQIPSCAFHVAYSNDDANSNNSNSSNGSNSVWVKTAIIAVVSILSFGGIHIFAWNFLFPTKIEQQLWRVCSVAATVLPLPYLATHYSFMKHGTNVGKKRIHQIRKIQGLLALFYVLTRLFLIVESLRSLYYLPRDAFESTWSVNFPHWG